MTPSRDQIIKIYREPTTEPLVGWEDASVLRAKDLTLQEVQQLHLAEETMDRVQEGGLAIDTLDGKWDARHTHIKNLDDPTSPLEAVNVRYLENEKTGISSDRQRAEQAATTATTQAGIATAKATEASQSASDALSYKNTSVSASGTATKAKNETVIAQGKAEEAMGSAVSAKEDASLSAEEAEYWAKKAQGAAGIASGIPTGLIIQWGGLTPPAGYMECKGQVMNTTTYPELFKAIGYTWGGAGEGFYLPNFYDAARFLRSRSNTLRVGTLQGDAMRNFTGTFRAVAYSGYGASGVFKTSDQTVTVTMPSGASIGGLDYTLNPSLQVPTADENRPVGAVVMYCIKVADAYINPAQVDIAQVAMEVAGKVNLTDYTSGSNSRGSWRIAPDGVITQEGAVVCNSSGYVQIVFPIAFPNNCEDITFTTSWGGMPTTTAISATLAGSLGNTAATVYGRAIMNGGAVAAATVTVLWTAKGR